MKILNSTQIKEADKATIANEPIFSIDLMERAALQCIRWLDKRDLDYSKNIHIFCGMGNNGGDGLAIARHLFEDDYKTATYTVHFSQHMSDDFITNYNRAEEIGIIPKSIHSEDDFPFISKDDIVIDAIFGIGLSKPVTGFTKKLIQHINNSKATVYAIDVPSGLFIDKPVEDKETVIKNAVVLTFQNPKLAFLLPDNANYVSGFTILNIGLDKKFIENIQTNNYLTIFKDLQPVVQKRDKFSHKGTYGHALIMGGSFGKIGATILAAKAALKIGSGLVTAFIPKCGYQIMQSSVPEVMVEVDAEDELNYFNYKSDATVIGIGIGMGTSDKTVKGFGTFLKNNKLPLVLDADALNILSKHKEYLEFLPKNSIITPHPKELERLIGSWNNDYEKIEKVKAFSLKYELIVVVKGGYTMVVSGDNLYFNSTGNPALAKAGTGDLLLGVITGLLAQNYNPLDAAVLGTYLHGKAADIHTFFYHENTLLASDMLALFSEAYLSITNPENEELYQRIDTEEEDEDFEFFDDDDETPF